MNLHVTNIAQTVTEIELRAFFERVALVTGVKLLLPGDALVSFESEADADRALAELDGSELSGKALSIRRALPRREREKNILSQEGTSDGRGTTGREKT